MEDDSTPRRRFALVTGWALFLFTNAGLELPSPLKVTIFGVELLVTTPQIFIWGLFLTTLYAFARYYYYDTVLKVTPMKARRLLGIGLLPIPEDLPGHPTAEVEPKVVAVMNRYYHGLEKGTGWQCEFERGYLKQVNILDVPLRIKLTCWLDNLDHLFPLIISGGAMLWFLGNVLTAWISAVVHQL
jgi:hypothetical protein